MTAAGGLVDALGHRGRAVVWLLGAVLQKHPERAAAICGALTEQIRQIEDDTDVSPPRGTSLRLIQGRGAGPVDQEVRRRRGRVAFALVAPARSVSR